MMRAWLLVLVALAGCYETTQGIARVNAPGNVPDLDLPVEHENGDPQRHETPVDPGVTDDFLWAVPYVQWGDGRGRLGGVETGLEMRYEHHDLAERGDIALTQYVPIFSLGGAIVQAPTNHPSLVPGALFAEVGMRTFLGDVFPIEVGAGPVVYTEDHAAGVQVTLRFLMFVPVRFRYTDHGGFEAMAGFQIPWPFELGHSR